MIKMTAFVTCALTVAGGSWYVAVDLTTASDLTAIYNCSAFFAYAFSIPLLKEKIRTSKIVAVAIAIAGVLIVAYGDELPGKSGNKSGGGTGGNGVGGASEPKNRPLGNLIIGIGSVLYGLYEVLYKRLMCPPDGCSPGRGMIFANTVGSLIGSFTLLVLWIPLPFLHITGIETFELPRGEAAWVMLISVLANASKFNPQIPKRIVLTSVPSFLWLFPGSHQSDFSCSIVCGCASDDFHCRSHGSTSSTTSLLASYRCCNLWWSTDHRRLPLAQLGYLQRDGRRKATEVGGRGRRERY